MRNCEIQVKTLSGIGLSARLLLYPKHQIMRQDRDRSLTLWTILLSLAALVWVSPPGIHDWARTSLLTRVYYSFSILGGLTLLSAGLRLAYLPHRRAMQAGLIAAAALGINQIAGLTLGSILCTSYI